MCKFARRFFGDGNLSAVESDEIDSNDYAEFENQDHFDHEISQMFQTSPRCDCLAATASRRQRNQNEATFPVNGSHNVTVTVGFPLNQLPGFSAANVVSQLLLVDNGDQAAVADTEVNGPSLTPLGSLLGSVLTMHTATSSIDLADVEVFVSLEMAIARSELPHRQFIGTSSAFWCHRSRLYINNCSYYPHFAQ